MAADTTTETATDALGWTEEMLPGRRRETSWHESGHALAGRLLGLPVEHVSIRPGDHFFGHCQSGAVDVPEWNGLPGALHMNHEWRGFIEREIIVALAGPIAGGWSGYQLGEVDEIDKTWATRAAVALDRVSPRTRELIVTFEAATTPGIDDETRARELAEKWGTFDDHPPLRITYYFEWLRNEAHDLLKTHFEHLKALAAALYDRPILTGPDIDDVLRGQRCRCHRWPKAVKP